MATTKSTQPGSAAEVDLTELGVISRYSLAVRTPRADRDELVALLLEDVAWLRSLPSAGRDSAVSSDEPQSDDGPVDEPQVDVPAEQAVEAPRRRPATGRPATAPLRAARPARPKAAETAAVPDAAPAARKVASTRRSSGT